MRIPVEKRIVFINSDNANIKLSNDDIYVDVPTNVMTVDDTNTEHIEVVLSEFVCNRDFKSVNETNNKYSIFYNGIDHIYSITEGFPNVLDALNQLKGQLQQEFSGETFFCSYLRVSGQTKIVCNFTGTVPHGLALNFDIENSCEFLFGFTKAKHTFNNPTGTIYELFSDGVINVLGNKKEIFIRSSLVNENYENTTEGGVIVNEILGKIPINAEPLSNINFTDGGADIFRTRLSTNNITGFNVRLTTEDENTLIGLNSNFLMTLTFIKMKQQPNTLETILNDLLDIERVKFLRDEERSKKKSQPRV